MMSSFTKQKEGYLSLVKKMGQYEEALCLLNWDLRTGSPKKGVERRSEVIGLLSTESFKLSVSEEMEGYLHFFSDPANVDKLEPMEQKMVMESNREFNLSRRIPADEYEAYVVLTAQSESVWEEAKDQSNFAMFQPYLEKIVATTQHFIDLWGYEGHKYNALLDQYEPGMTIAQLDQIFGSLKEQLIPLVSAVGQSEHQPDTHFLNQRFTKSQQQAFNIYILKELGYDFAAGRLDETVHPFAMTVNLGDVRITTRYLEDQVVSALFGTIHECGHALYEQNISPLLLGTNLCTGTTMGIHESQSRFWENVVGRSRAFWQRYFPHLQQAFPGQLDDVSSEQFYQAINEAKPSLVRIEADELTYNLHIIMRYEMEKALIGGDVKVADLPAYWNEKSQQYFGIVPPDDGMGVLQDVHWSGGSFGYFPSYALGNMYAAQFTHTLKQQMPTLMQTLPQGNLRQSNLG